MIRYYSNATGASQLSLWLPAAVNDGLRRVRLVRAGMDASHVSAVLQDVSVVCHESAVKRIRCNLLPGRDRVKRRETRCRAKSSRCYWLS